MNSPRDTSTLIVDLEALYRLLTHQDRHCDTHGHENPAAAQPFSLELRFTVQRESRRRYRFEPRHTGPGWWRFEDEWTGCQWRPVGREVLAEVELQITAQGANHNE
ncbi:hypothetical protein [Halobellus rufus]|uniref:hypothetical protein n=1 Tax=Halobellus rufus TaxID=1448860 RepID=UPI0018CD3D04|nr:hypothetical protein [Halobellus rufus]